MTQPDHPYREGRACFQVGAAFFRPRARPARDLGVLSARLERRDQGQLRVLETMAGSGIRSLRYALEADADMVHCSDADPDVVPLLRANLSAQLPPERWQATRDSADRRFAECFARQTFYDLVDVDGFGSGGSHLARCLDAVRVGGLLYFTATDGRATTGHDRRQSRLVYGADARAHPASQEQGLRLILATLQQQAWMRGFGLRPLFSLFNGETFRVMVRLLPKPTPPDRVGWLGYCHHCGEYQRLDWPRGDRLHCPEDGQPLVLSGPLWVAPLHDDGWLSRLREEAEVEARQSPEPKPWRELVPLIDTLCGEADLPPWFYTLGEIGRRGRMDPPRREDLLQRLRRAGYRAEPSHIQAAAVKTDASLATCLQLAVIKL
jgi:tRNA (guanine26-N2/guanine27-N2)-dimethyltransferase